MLFVSSANPLDYVSIEILRNQFFVARSDKKQMEPFLIESADLPRLFASKADAENIEDLG